jgi:H+-transporting ATPase
LFYLGERVFHLDRVHIQTLMYLKLSVAGHLTIFLTRTRGPFWSIRPARVLWAAVLGTQLVATLIAVYGLFMTPLGWGWALFVWGYALAWFLVNDRVKLLAYRIFDPVKAEPKPEAKAERKPEAKAESKPEAKAEPKPEAKAEPKPDAKGEPKAEVKAEPKPEAKAETKPEAKAEPQPEAKAERKPEAKAESKPEAKAEPKPEAKAEPKPKPETKVESKPETKAEPKPEANTEPQPETKSKTPSDLTPGLVKRVHELYEELGRKDVQAVEELEKGERENRKAEGKAEPNPEAKGEPNK